MADLTGAHLESANLFWARLDGALLVNAHLEGANLTGARLRGVGLRNAQLQGATLDGADCAGADLDGAQLDGAKLELTDLKTARNLTPQQLESAENQGRHALLPAKPGQSAPLVNHAEHGSVWPITGAAGVALLLFGIVTHIWLSIAGGILTLVSRVGSEKCAASRNARP